MEVKIRKDLNDMVKRIELKKIKTRYSEKTVCQVTLFNNVVFDFNDNEGLYGLLSAAKLSGNFEEIFKSRELVEEVKTDSVIDCMVDEATGTYICVLYKLNIKGVERTFRLFMDKPLTNKPALDIYYDSFKSQQKAKIKPQV